MEDRRNVGENSCNSGDGTDQTGPILDVYDDDDRMNLMSVFCERADEFSILSNLEFVIK